MDFTEWEPIYEEILADFGYERGADEQARDRLAGLLTAPGLSPADLDMRGTVAVAAPGPTLASELERVQRADVVIGVSAAATTLRSHDLAVDCMVTDLDGDPATARTLTSEGTPVAVHAHGDNVGRLTAQVPKMNHEAVLPTTQARPTDRVYNVGGFTDGDRAAFLADACGAEGLVFPGWKLADSTVGADKRRKLAWAGRLLGILEDRRNERFALLDGLRGELSLPSVGSEDE